MSRLFGTGLDAALRAGGAEAPDVVTRRSAVGSLLIGYHLYGYKDLGRGWNGCIADALKTLDPEAHSHLCEHEDAALTLQLYGGDPFDRANETR